MFYLQDLDVHLMRKSPISIKEHLKRGSIIARDVFLILCLRSWNCDLYQVIFYFICSRFRILSCGQISSQMFHDL